jgi:hypothetical protein
MSLVAVSLIEYELHDLHLERYGCGECKYTRAARLRRRLLLMLMIGCGQYRARHTIGRLHGEVHADSVTN